MNKIFNFHVVSDAFWFEKVLLFLKSKYKIISIQTLEEYMFCNIESKNLCHITIDDGDKSFYQNIYPVLKKHKVPASLFVSPKICSEKRNFWFQEIIGYDQKVLTGIIADVSGVPYLSIKKYRAQTVFKTQPICRIEEIIKRYQNKTNTRIKPPQNISADDLIEINRENLVTIGAHTISHPILKNENDSSSNHEISESVSYLSTILNTRIKYFAYPNGIRHFDFSEREELTLKKAGIQLAFTTEAKNFLSCNNKLRLPRFGISDVEKMIFIKAKVIMGSQWHLLQKLNINGEYQQRKRLTSLHKKLSITKGENS